MPRRKNPIQNANQNSEKSYFSIGENGSKSYSSKALAKYDIVQRSTGSLLGFDLSNLQPNVSARPEFTRDTYSLYRPSEALPTKYTDILAACEKAYKMFGICRQTLDLMSDFTCQGIRISHPRPSVQRFYRRWWQKIQGDDRSERFLSSLYKLGTVVVRMQTQLVPFNDRRTLDKSLGADMEPEEEIDLSPREIPLKYTFLHPGLVRNVGGPFSGFMRKQKLVMDIPRNIRRELAKIKDKFILDNIPHDILRAIEKGSVELDKDKTFIYFFKKEDWEERPLPIIYPILNSLVMLNKLRLADSAALDGAISNIRIFKLGDLENKILPTDAAVSRLSEILEANVGGGTIDLIWDPAITLEESKTDIHNFLGEEKYKPHLDDIHTGLGIPITLNSSGSSGTTNNFISLKTLIKRLEYGRKKLIEFWKDQIDIVQKQMGFRDAPVIEFDADDFGDENTLRRLLIEMSDRNLISDELLQYKLGHDPELEQVRIERENKEREDDQRVPKSSPYHDPQFKIALKKIALQQKLVTPEQVGIELEEGTEEQTTPFDKDLEIRKQQKTPPAPGKSTPKGSNGRPSGSKDTQPRQRRTFSPRTRALQIWCDEAQNKISEILKPYILDHFGKKNMRTLSSEEAKYSEKVKFGVLSNIEAFSEIDERSVGAALTKPFSGEIFSELNKTIAAMYDELGRQLTYDEIHKLQSYIYTARNSDVSD